MKVEESVLIKAARLKKTYGAEKAIQIIEADRQRFLRQKVYYKATECAQAIIQIQNGSL